MTINKSNYLKGDPATVHALSQLKTAKRGSGWEEQVAGVSNKLLKKAATELFTMYLSYLIKKNSSGEVIMESSSELQDMLIYSAYNRMMTSGFPPLGLSSRDIRKYFTGISFVTKLNHDIESQLADIAAHYLNLECKLNDGIISKFPKTHDADIINILKSKGFSYKNAISGIRETSLHKMY